MVEQSAAARVRSKRKSRRFTVLSSRRFAQLLDGATDDGGRGPEASIRRAQPARLPVVAGLVHDSALDHGMIGGPGQHLPNCFFLAAVAIREWESAGREDPMILS